jgi:NitT/TauT family transport system permease protein
MLVTWVSGTWRPLAVIVALIVLWWLLSAMHVVKPYLLPSPWTTWQAIIHNAGYLWTNTLTTAFETVAAFIVSIIFGIVAGVVMVYSKTIEKTLYPLLVLAQVVPKIALAPLFVVWLGFGNVPKILVAFLIAFFPVVVSSFVGLRSVDPEIIDLAATMNASPLQMFFKFRFPASLPHLFSGIKVAATLAVTGAVVGEFVGSNNGIGNVILEANGNVNTPMLFSGLIVLSLFGVILFVIVEVIERLVMPWHSSHRLQSTAVMTS